MTRRAAAAVLLLLAAGDAARAQSLRYSLKSSALLEQLPEAPLLFPQPDSATGFWRFRVEPSIAIGSTSALDVAIEQRLRVFSTQVYAAGILPAEAPAPYRVRQLDWQLAASGNAEWRAEIDRAAVRVALPRANVTVGRQAIGWGRGVVFGAVDLFSPFAPLEADREWRRGVDAVRADVKVASRLSLDSVAAFGETMDDSAFAARLRGYAGRVDVEGVAGWRAGDRLIGATSSAAVGDCELHGEAAWFSGVIKAVAGGSYRVPIGHGVLVYGEYHYSGYGATSPEAMLRQLQDPEFQKRYLRGDTQILGRHAIAAVASYERSPEVTWTGQWLHSPADGSGVIAPALTYTPGDRWSVVVNVYVPYGHVPSGDALRSEFGAAPLALFAQLRVYR